MIIEKSLTRRIHKHQRKLLIVVGVKHMYPRKLKIFFSPILAPKHLINILRILEKLSSQRQKKNTSKTQNKTEKKFFLLTPICFSRQDEGLKKPQSNSPH
jgi:hypothetical protein